MKCYRNLRACDGVVGAGPGRSRRLGGSANTSFNQAGLPGHGGGPGPRRSRRLGVSDNTSFNQAGLPGIGMGQDPIEYQSHTWHTNLDTYERILEDDVKDDAMVVAWAVYQWATRDDLLPRFAKSDMPPKSAQETSSQPATAPVRTEAQAKPAAKTTRSHAHKRRSRR